MSPRSSKSESEYKSYWSFCTRLFWCFSAPSSTPCEQYYRSWEAQWYYRSKVSIYYHLAVFAYSNVDYAKRNFWAVVDRNYHRCCFHRQAVLLLGAAVLMTYVSSTWFSYSFYSSSTTAWGSSTTALCFLYLVFVQHVCRATLPLGAVIRLKRIYNFWCSMLVFTPFA
jgi:hypothetical protein